LASFAKQVDRNKVKLKEVISFAKESVNLQFTSSDILQVYQQLDNPTVCKYLALIREAEGEALKDPESASATLKNASIFLDKTLTDTDKMLMRGM
jgi:hypothetical protein